MAARPPPQAILALQQRIGHEFADQSLIVEALTHASASEGKPHAPKNYERLEFLGDRVLGLVMSERLYRDFPSEGENKLAPRFNALVNRGACARAARRADLGAAIALSPSEDSSGGRGKDAILADVCESVIAALYLDAGFEAAKGFIERFWEGEFEAVQRMRKDAKTAMQEWAAARRRDFSYIMVDRSGPEHAPRFVVELRVAGFEPTRGEGGSKREAEQAAAAALLEAAGIDA